MASPTRKDEIGLSPRAKMHESGVFKTNKEALEHNAKRVGELKKKALEKKKGGHKQGEREWLSRARSIQSGINKRIR